MEDGGGDDGDDEDWLVSTVSDWSEDIDPVFANEVTNGGDDEDVFSCYVNAQLAPSNLPIFACRSTFFSSGVSSNPSICFNATVVSATFI